MGVFEIDTFGGGKIRYHTFLFLVFPILAYILLPKQLTYIAKQDTHAYTYSAGGLGSALGAHFIALDTRDVVL